MVRFNYKIRRKTCVDSLSFAYIIKKTRVFFNVKEKKTVEIEYVKYVNSRITSIIEDNVTYNSCCTKFNC